jgi:hypothetical protein
LRGEIAFLERFVFRLLAKRLQDRYDSAQEAPAELLRLGRQGPRAWSGSWSKMNVDSSACVD